MTSMSIAYKINEPIEVDTFAELLRASALGERRPIDDRQCMQGMLTHANLTVTAWHLETLIGIARSLTDFHYACYLSDLAVHRNYQRHGVGKRLQALTQESLGPRCTLILLAAPAANTYYEHIGYEHHPRAWVLSRNRELKT